MTAGTNMAEIAALIADPSRANMLAALMDGRALTAGELARVAGVAAPTASGHLGKLTQGGLLAGAVQGRHRYFRLASPEVARMLESLMVMAGDAPARRRATPRIPPGLRDARSCYDHLAGRLAVALTDSLIDRGVLTPDAEQVTDLGQGFMRDFGITPDPASRRPYCRACLDWSERRPHVAGAVGAGLLDRTLALGWIARQSGSRAIRVTQSGRQGFADVFGVQALP